MLWPELTQVPSGFVLYGGTAIALRLGHRQSVDFDFFGFHDIDPDRLLTDIPFLRSATTLQREKNTLTVLIDHDGPVKLSFFGVPRLRRLHDPDQAGDNHIQVASLLDLAGTNASVVQIRAEAKDYVDLDAIMTGTHIGLAHALGAARSIYGQNFNPQLTLKALSYFDDGNLREIPGETRERLAAAARSVDLDALPTFTCIIPP